MSKTVAAPVPVDRDWLERWTSPYPGRHDIYREPWRLDAGGVTHVVVTDGRNAVLVPGPGEGLPAPSPEGAALLRQVLLDPPREVAAETTLAGLRAWLGPPGPEVCPHCGRGEDDDDFGGGHGTPRGGVLCGEPVDRRRLAQLLEPWPEGEVTVNRLSNGALSVRGEGWEVVTMPLHREGCEEEWPALPRTPAVGEGRQS